MNKISIYLFVASFYSVISFAQPIYTQRDVDICKSKFDLAVADTLAAKPINDVIVEIGKSFIGTEYGAGTLENYKEERPIIHLTGLDCYTFLEGSLVFARCIKSGKTTFDDFEKELENIRYRGGKLNQYPSRLHYFSDWIFDMNKRGIGEDITKEIGGVPYVKKIDYMSTHIGSYRQLKENPEFVKQIKQIEKEISSRQYYYIPEDSIETFEDKIQDGDIIGITTNMDGLDISHTGIAVRTEDGRIHLMHAPNVGYKVQISEKPLAEYIKDHKKQTGIMVLRAK